MITWLPSIQDVARAAALADDRARLGWVAEETRLPPFAYRWEHVQQVARNGAWLLTQHPAADADVVLAACWLHDVRKGERQHARRGAEFAEEWLPGTDFPSDKIALVAEAIRQHEGLFRPAEGWDEARGEPFRPAPPLQPIEAALLWDADKLAKIGPVALLHFLPFQFSDLLREGRSATTEELHAGNRRWLETIAPRLLISFNTCAAQRRALPLHAAFEHFFGAAEIALHS